MDWNIFFSTVTQTSAAIVAIWGAFIIAKILNNETTYINKISQMRSVWNTSHSLTMRASMRLKDFTYSIRYEALKELKKLITNSELLSIKEYYLKLDFSWYDNRNEIFDLLEKILDGSSDSAIILTNIDRELQELEMFNLSENERNKIGVAIQEKYVEVYENTNKVYFLIKDLESNPESSKIIQWSLIGLAILFCIGVIFPLSFLPTSIDFTISISELCNRFSLLSFSNFLLSFRGLIIFSITVPFLALLIYFFIKNAKLKYKKKSISNLKEYLEKKTYNIYFGYFDDNGEYFRNNTKIFDDSR